MRPILTIPGEMVSLNEYINAERTNRYKAAAIKKDETERVYWEARQQKLEGELGKHDFRFTWYVKDRRKDPDNCFFACKFIFDGLVKAGVIHCDGQECVGSIVHNPIQIDAKRPRVEVIILSEE